uniref:protein SMAX1-LIKE 6-like n=1 Tax=Erigeron canadensis TaxID=72917 RepID=UPI001CB95D14|nr:protein SMAX1-LIKE 6-like [Erigeron canadensis]
MPTPVSIARQCLTDEAARALDDAVAVARRRSHGQTTSLHAVSSLLTLPTSTLREACARARSSAYSPRLQFRALELCVSVSLDRLPCSKSKTLDAEPPVSNSLMAAIKRSQANQRRHPETFHLYQMHQQMMQQNSQTTSLSCVKVELKHFILSILDDPIVSRVFGDAGFRSADIKIAILHPPLVSGGFQKSLIPPMFLCNLPEARTGFNFPFVVDQEEEDFKRIGQVLAKKTSKNPLLVGVSADTMLRGFIDGIKISKVGLLPSEIAGLNVVDVDKEVSEFCLGTLSEDMMELKLNEVREKVESCENCGVIVNFGDLKVFLEGGCLLEYVVAKVSDLVRICGGKLWLIGSVGSYEIYMKIMAKFKNLEKEWDLSVVPITCSKLSSPNGSQKKSSLMGSFVPFGGCFPAQNELGNSLCKSDQAMTRCDHCNEKYEQEVSVVMKGGRTASVADQQLTGLAPWMQIPESDTTNGNGVIEAKDHGGVLNARVVALQRKWNDICQRIHQRFPSQQNSSQIRARVPFPHHVQPDAKLLEISGQDSNQEIRPRKLSPPIEFFANMKNPSTTSSPATSITTDLGLGNIYVLPDLDRRPPTHETHLQTFCGAGSAEVDEISMCASDGIKQSYEKDFKQLYRALVKKVGYPNDSIHAISQTISRFRTANGRRHVWLNFSGSDRVGKKKISAALAEVVFGSRESLISIDLNFENQIRHPSSVFDGQSINFSDSSFRGKTATGFIAEELIKKPRSVVLLEHIDKADFVTQDSLSLAIRTGKLSGTHGRETRITDAIFVTTTSTSKELDTLTYSEESILNAKALQMRISVETSEAENSSVLLWPKESVSRNPEMSKKRKIIEVDDFEIMVPKVKKLKSCFDLNLPIEEPEESDNDTVSDTREVWLEEFIEQVDEKVVFKPFDFNSCAETILKQISKCFRNSFGTNVVLEINNEVMVQMLASYWLSDRKGEVENWIDTILYRGFKEVKEQRRVHSESIVKLVALEGVMIKDDATCVCLPSRIMVK